MGEYDPNKVTWAALLARWIRFAQAAVALPDDAEGRAWRAAVPDIIVLQAVTMALEDLDELSHEERALGIDRSRVLTRRHSDHLRELFPQDIHPLVSELISDAENAIYRAAAQTSRQNPD